MKSAEIAVACQDVTREYQVDRHRFSALADIDLAVPAGRFAAVIGPSGAGKSTLLRLLAAIDAPDRGTITVMGRDVGALPERKRARFRRVQLGFVRQTPADNLLEYLTVRQHLRLGAQMRGRRGVHDGELLPALGMADRANRLPRQLSGGEQQRLAIAFAAAGSPAVLIADEPTGQLDHAHVDDVVDAFRTIASTGIAVIAATHDPAVWERADLVIRLRGGRIDREHA